jgi:hypothetical protein
VALLGTEVKAIREGRVNLRDSYARAEGGEIWVYNIHISPYTHRGYADHEPTRRRSGIGPVIALPAAATGHKREHDRWNHQDRPPPLRDRAHFAGSPLRQTSDRIIGRGVDSRRGASAESCVRRLPGRA